MKEFYELIEKTRKENNDDVHTALEIVSKETGLTEGELLEIYDNPQYQ